MSKYAGTKTEKNLMDAFAGESQARNKYTYYASAAKKAGYEQLAALYLETAEQEKEHAKMWFKEFHGIQDVAANLEDAAAGKTTNGRTCMHAWREKQEKKASRSWLSNSKALQRWKPLTKNATKSFWNPTEQIKPLKAMLLLAGNAATADMYIWLRRHRDLPGMRASKSILRKKSGKLLKTALPASLPAELLFTSSVIILFFLPKPALPLPTDHKSSSHPEMIRISRGSGRHQNIFPAVNLCKACQTMPGLTGKSGLAAKNFSACHSGISDSFEQRAVKVIPSGCRFVAAVLCTGLVMISRNTSFRSPAFRRIAMSFTLL